MSRSGLEALELSGLEPGSGELVVGLVWLVLGELGLDEDDLKGARRRALFVLAAGGDPHRELDLNAVAAERLADELDTPERRARLEGALAGLDAQGLPTVATELQTLRSEPELAWRSVGLALLADELADG